jgi:uncharacterized protein
MRLDLSHLRQAETPVDRQYAAEAFAPDHEDFRVVAPVHLSLVVHKDHERYRLVGQVQTTLELTCSRCLEPFGQSVTVPFDLRYFPEGADVAPSGGGEGESRVEDSDTSVSFYRDDEIDLGALMNEQFYLALPMKPLCREACKGLCAQCGANLNEAPCQCVSGWTDPRLAGLKSLLTERKHDDA